MSEPTVSPRPEVDQGEDLPNPADHVDAVTNDLPADADSIPDDGQGPSDEDLEATDEQEG